ncbi:DNA helicase IV [Microlunatus sagamiharensis]|uniref:DNA helicase IV n=1 Tax=Microlunatus sagamiharensis TaxID=546874 RepID=A0A1H2MRT8_9ACTN|nr:UvrD-helicase domain-containing protein [Microlunatus sagamiharensis]SDU95226.1 DNA helicase IV [Microlunatus sagamiharensis]
MTLLVTEARPDPLASEIAVEQAHVDLVYARLGEATRSAQQVATAGRSLHSSDRESYVREEDGTRLYERDVFAFQSAKRLAVLDAEHEGLVFGRLDRTDGEVRYVGRIGVRDEDYEPLVIDWRAPAAEPFYRATPTQPMQVVRRRVLRCQGPTVVGIEDDLLDSENADGGLVVIGEGALMAALSRARGHQMRDIVATIQAEQDEAIRAPYQGFTLISGGPGTGKTVVGLHRAAYLLYSNRRRFESGGVLVVGPSRVFLNYIERVLPSLGEESVTLRSMGSVPSDVLAVTGERVDDAPTAAVKGSLRMLPVLKRLVLEPLADQPLELRVVVQGQVLVLRSGQLAGIRRDVLSHHKLNAGREAAEKALLNALWRSRPREVDMERDEFDDVVTSLASFTTFGHAWWPSVSATSALRRLSDPALAARLSEGSLERAEAELLSAGTADLDRLGPTVADAALLDELVHLLGPVPAPPEENETSLFLDADSEYAEIVTTADRLSVQREVDPFDLPHRTYAHVLIDEAQDVTPMQWRMLRRRGASASWTIVGDGAQSSWPDAAEADRALREIIGTAPVRRFRMSTNYRSPAEVFDLASRVVVEAYPEADLPTAVRSTGVEPLLAVAQDLRRDVVEQVRALLGQVDGTVGVVCPPSRRDTVLADLEGAALDGADRIAVVTSLESKGLEYDGVLVVTPDDVVAESPGGVRSLYVSLTRPTQRLVTLDEGRPGRWRPAGA